MSKKEVIDLHDKLKAVKYQYRAEVAKSVFISQKLESVTEFEMPFYINTSELRVVRAFQSEEQLKLAKKAVVKGL